MPFGIEKLLQVLRTIPICQYYRQKQWESSNYDNDERLLICFFMGRNYITQRINREM